MKAEKNRWFDEVCDDVESLLDIIPEDQWGAVAMKVVPEETLTRMLHGRIEVTPKLYRSILITHYMTLSEDEVIDQEVARLREMANEYVVKDN